MTGSDPRAEDVLSKAISSHIAGDISNAEAGYRRAADMGNPHAAFQLGVLLQDRGDIEGATRAYTQAASHPEGDMEARLNLAALLEASPDGPQEALALYRMAADEGDRRAMFSLAMLLRHHGDIEGTARVLQQMVDSGAPRGHLHMGFLLAEEDRRQDALAAFTDAANSHVSGAWTQVG